MEITVRTIIEDDAASFLEMLHTLDHETRFMMFEPQERTTTVDQQRSRIASALANPNSTILVADADGEIVGFVAAEGGTLNRIRHRAYIVAGVRQSHANQGVGRRLFEALDEWARGISLHRLELTVMAHNDRAIHLYEMMGFVREGTKHHSMCIDGDYIDEFYMAKLMN